MLPLTEISWKLDRANDETNFVDSVYLPRSPFFREHQLFSTQNVVNKGMMEEEGQLHIPTQINRMYSILDFAHLWIFEWPQSQSAAKILKNTPYLPVAAVVVVKMLGKPLKRLHFLWNHFSTFTWDSRPEIKRGRYQKIATRRRNIIKWVSLIDNPKLGWELSKFTISKCSWKRTCPRFLLTAAWRWKNGKKIESLFLFSPRQKIPAPRRDFDAFSRRGNLCEGAYSQD